MTNFMYRSSYTLQPIVGTISCGDSYIGGMTTSGEWMNGNIQTTFIEIKSYDGLTTSIIGGERYGISRRIQWWTGEYNDGC